jgi:TPR repeat protein
VPTFSAVEIAALLARGDWLFATGDVASARLLYERASDAGEAQAAVRLGETFDPVYLDGSHLRGLHGDPDMAVFWYRHARDLGATEVANRLKKLEAKEGRN